MFEERNECLKLLHKYLNSDGIKKQIEPQGYTIHSLTVFGSFATHCASKFSDLDVCVCASHKEKRKPLPVTILQSIHRDLQHNEESKKLFEGYEIHEISFVQTARIPIIRFKMNNTSVDMSATFEKSPPRTSLAAKYINAYCQLDDRFKILVLFLKHWLKSDYCQDTHLRDYPNSYSLILMLIHVLQWFGIMPNLHQTHKEIFQVKNFKSWSLAEIGPDFKFPLDENTVALHRRNSTNHLSVVQLLFLFACQYSEESILTFYRLNMRSGDIESRSLREPITIVDVYDTRNPGRTVRSVFDIMGASRELLSLFGNPQKDMFTKLLRITSDKLYLFPLLSLNEPINNSYRAQQRRQNGNHWNQQNQQFQPQAIGNYHRNHFMSQPMTSPRLPMAPPEMMGYPRGNSNRRFGEFPNSNYRNYDDSEIQARRFPGQF